MIPGQIIKVKADRRFKTGNIKRTGIELRGNPDTVYLKHLDTTGLPIEYQLNPPIVISRELGDAISSDNSH